MIELTDQGYVALGQSQEVEAREAEQAILAAAPQAEGDAITLDALLTAAKTGRTTGQRVIEVFLADGKLTRLGKGVKGDPHRYWHSKIHSAQTPTYNAQHESPNAGMGKMVI
jgi:hypothetical protein